jgi:hypothetical protein
MGKRIIGSAYKEFVSARTSSNKALGVSAAEPDTDPKLPCESISIFTGVN